LIINRINVFSNLTALPLGVPYQEFQINTTMITNLSIANAILEFKVNKTWATNKDVIAKDIVIYRMKDNDSLWNPLNTTFLNEDEKYYYFSAVTPGFSTFLIFSNQNICVPNARRCFNNQSQLCLQNTTWMTTEQCPDGCSNEGCSNIFSNNPPIIYGVIILIVLIIGATLLSKNKKIRKHSKHIKKKRRK
jgi:hypothetical protein